MLGLLQGIAAVPNWTIETSLALKNGNSLVHRCVVEADDQGSAMKKAKSAWNRDVRFGTGDFTQRVVEGED